MPLMGEAISNQLHAHPLPVLRSEQTQACDTASSVNYKSKHPNIAWARCFTTHWQAA